LISRLKMKLTNRINGVFALMFLGIHFVVCIMVICMIAMYYAILEIPLIIFKKKTLQQSVGSISRKLGGDIR